MSSILKALKKLEQDKAQYSPDAMKIDTEILRGPEANKKTSPVFTVALLMLFFGGGVSVAYYFLNNNGPVPNVVESRPETVASEMPAANRIPASPPVIKVEKKPVKKGIVNNAKPRVKDVPAVKAPAGQPGKSLDGAGSSERKSDLAVTSKKEIAPRTGASSLRVYGIAFNKNGEESLAIVNGSPVSKGTLIEGASVVDIKNDRVLFQRNGEKFEIMLGQTQ